MYFVKITAIITCGITTKETAKAYLLDAFCPFSKLIFKAVMFNILGVIEPVKEKKKPKNKSNNKFNSNYLHSKYTRFPIATIPVKAPKIKSILVAM